MQHIRLIGVLTAFTILFVVMVGTGSAGASGFLSESSKTTLSGTLTENFSWDAEGEQSCSGGSLSGSMALSGQVSVPTAWAKSTCSSGYIEPQSCGLTLRPGSETSPGKFSGTVDIGPSGCGPAFAKGGFFCGKQLISAQSGLGATYENVGSGSSSEVIVSLDSAVAYSLEKGCGGGTYQAWISANWRVAGTDADTGKQTGIRIGGSTGLYLEGSQSSEQSKQPKIAGEKYPAGMISAPGSLAFQTEFGEVTCSQASFSGALTQATANFSLYGEPGACSVLGWNGTAKMNSCNYAVHLLNVGPPYKGTFAIGCTNPADAIEFIASGGLCTIKVPGQTLEGVSLSTVGSGSERKVSMSLKLNGVAYSGTDGFCIGSGEEPGHLETAPTFQAFG